MLPSTPALALLLLAAAAHAQTSPSHTLPPQTPIPGAPTAGCDFPNISPDTPIRITTGDTPIPYQFACGHTGLPASAPSTPCLQA